MAFSCPNKNLPEWKELVDKIGEEYAMAEYIREGKIPNPSLYMSKAEIKDYYLNQTSNEKQQQIINDLLEAQEGMRLTDDEKNYTDGKSLYTRVSTFLFGVDERTKNLSPVYKERGNAMHKVVEMIILGKSRYDTLKATRKYLARGNDMNEGQLGKFYEDMSKWVKLKQDEGVVLLAEVMLKAGDVAGSADIVAINPDGSIDIFDLKTSKNSTISMDYTDSSKNNAIEDKSSLAYKLNGGPVQLSTKDKHIYQQTVYGRMIEGLGHTVRSLNILPYNVVDGPKGPTYTKEGERQLTPKEEIAKVVLPILPKKKIEVKEIKEVKWSTKILDDIAIFLEQRLKRALESTNENASKKIRKIQREIAEVDDVKKVVTFIDKAHDELSGNNGLAARFENKLAEIKEKVEKGEITPEQAIKEMDYYKIYAEGYHILDTIFEDVDVDYATLKENTTIGKLKGAIEDKDRIIKQYRDNVKGFIAKWLAEQASSEINTKAAENIKRIDDRIAVAIKYDNQKQLKKLRLEKQAYIDALANEENIVEALTTIRQDVPMSDYLFETIASSGNKVLALFAKQVKKYFEEARMSLMEFSRSINTEYELYKASRGYTNDASKFNEGLYETRIVGRQLDDGSWEDIEVAAFVDRVDWNKYRQAKSEFQESIKHLDPKDKRIAMKKWSMENNEPLSKAEMDEIIDMNRSTMDEATFAEWVIDSMYDKQEYSKHRKSGSSKITYANALITKHKAGERLDYFGFKGDLHKPKSSSPTAKYYNQAYAEYEDSAPDTPKKRYYKYLVNTYLNAQKRLPRAKRRGLFLPSVPKGDTDRLVEQGFKGLSTILKESVNYSAEDEATMEYRSLDGKDKTLPVRYVSKMEQKDISLNLAATIAMFEAESLKYEQSYKLVPMANAILDTVSSVQPLATNADGINKVDAMAKKLGIADKYVAKHGANLTAAWLESFIDMQIYGATSERETWKNLDTGKIADTLIKATSVSTIAGDWMKGLANSLQANLMLLIESFAGEHITNKSLAKAKLKYMKYTADGSFIKDSMKPFNESFIGQMTDYFDAIQGKYMDEYGKELGWNAAKKSVQSRGLFFMMNMGEHEAQVTMMLGMMQEYKVMLNGSEVSLDEAFELRNEDGVEVFRIKNGVTKLDGSEFTEQDRFEFMEKMHGVNKRLHGIYNSFDRVHVKRYALGRMLMLFRNFLYPALMRRFKNLSSDQETGGFTEGYYITFWNNIGKDLLTLKFSNIAKWSELSDLEKANMKRFLTEASLILITGAAGFALSLAAAGTDDDDTMGFILHNALYQANRMNAELAAYISPMDFLRIMRSPTATSNTVEKLWNVVYYTAMDPVGNFIAGEEDTFSRYKRDTGKFEKGSMKMSAAWQKLFGFHGRTYNPEEAVKLLNFTR